MRSVDFCVERQTQTSDLRIRFATVSKTLSRYGLGLVLVLLTLGLVFVLKGLTDSDSSNRPVATGSVGAVHVYGQNDEGAFRLYPARLSVLERPQHLAFELHVEGKGPRSVYIELDTGQKKWRMFNERIQAPKTNWYLEYVMDLDDNVPDGFTVLIRVDAPHAKAVESRFPIRLTRPSGK